ncbi:hypothetical protein C8D92_101441 [Tamilnaduibacter salinus]|uniref:Ion transporter n=1 Tax=Tamilnaduibacter salinus TaxID=1484056 RepID=A0A2A2I3J7_9GAMM|nr:hypothetical protein [Tamilnaduibacter salinus]PAV25695.1 hypothetical protein CF392_09630 [Tamilnaduibacter salinus]PVY79228.1 hypothetical protein C8D92_101441 [Tamilnaduibacter salinus]
MFTINRENLRKSHQLIWFVVDFLMLGLLIINLTWIILDGLYAIDAIRDLLLTHVTTMAEAYRPIHRNFFFYDLIFVGIFLTEFTVRWIYAVATKAYARWYFYPFLHWYDLLGCIPAGGYRFLRVLRVISIIYRLQKYNIIDITSTRLFQFLQFYYEAFLEELTDRIVIKVLSGAQEEINEGSPLFHKVQNEILLPRRDLVTNWLSDRVAQAAQTGYLPNRGALRHYLEGCVDEALAQNVELRRLRLVPVLGNQISQTLDDAVGDIVAHVIHQILDDLASSRNHDFIEDIVATFLQDTSGQRPAPEAQQQLIDVINEILEAVKHQVAVKRWRDAL